MRSGVVVKKTDRDNGFDGGWAEFKIIPTHRTCIVFIVLKTIIWDTIKYYGFNIEGMCLLVYPACENEIGA
jgi:hypothetical protein